MAVGGSALDPHARSDGRTENQVRPLECSRGLLARAHGSASWSQEQTTVMAAVYGPKAVGGKRENAERAIVEVNWRPKSGLPGNFEKEAELVLRRSLEYIILAALHPNTGISVILQVINDDGSLLACAMNAACAALVDAGIPLSGLLAAVSCGVTHEGQVFLDPSKQEEQKSKAHVCLVFPSRPLSAVPGLPLDVDGEPVQHGIVTCVTRGAMEVQEYIKCVELGRAASAKISDFSRTSIERCQFVVETPERGAVDIISSRLCWLQVLQTHTSSISVAVIHKHHNVASSMAEGSEQTEYRNCSVFGQCVFPIQSIQRILSEIKPYQEEEEDFGDLYLSACITLMFYELMPWSVKQIVPLV